MRWLWQCVRAALKPTAPARRSPAPRLEPLEDRLLLAGRFGTPNVEASAKSAVRTMCREAALDLDALAAIVDRVGDG